MLLATPSSSPNCLTCHQCHAGHGVHERKPPTILPTQSPEHHLGLTLVARCCLKCITDANTSNIRTWRKVTRWNPGPGSFRGKRTQRRAFWRWAGPGLRFVPLCKRPPTSLKKFFLSRLLRFFFPHPWHGLNRCVCSRIGTPERSPRFPHYSTRQHMFRTLRISQMARRHVILAVRVSRFRISHFETQLGLIAKHFAFRHFAFRDQTAGSLRAP